MIRFQNSARSAWALAALLVLAAGCSVERRDWEAAKMNPSTAAYAGYLTKYPDGRFAAEAKRGLEECEFRDAEAARTIDGYRAFLTRHPGGPFSERALAAADDLEWQAAEFSWSWPGWEKYLAANPRGKHADEARVRLEDLRSARSEGFRDVRTLRVSVRQSFADEGVKDISLGFGAVIDQLLPFFGLERAGAEDKADAAISVVSDAEALGGQYSAFGIAASGDYYYTGAQVSGVITLSVPGGRSLREDFQGLMPAPQTVTLPQATEASGAPYATAMERDFPAKAAGLLARAFGGRALVGALSAGAGPGQDDVVKALSHAGGEPLLDALIRATGHPNPKIAIGAARALGGHREARAVEALARCLEQEGPAGNDVRAAAARSLGRLGSLALPALESSQKDGREHVREAAAGALAWIRDAKALDILKRLLDDPALAVRRAAVEAVGELRTRAAINILLDRLNAPANDLRSVCLDAVGKSASETPVDESEDTENEIVQADFSWDAGLVTRLVNAAALLPGDAETKAKLAAMIAGISELGGSPSLTAAMAQGRKAESPAVRACAADVLGRAQSPGAVRALSAAASDANTTVRLEVAKALAAISETQTIEPLSRLIGDPEPAVRSAAIRGLKERLTLDDSRTLYQRFLGSAATIKILIEAMTIETSDRVAERDAAAEVLGRIGKPCVDPLLAGLKSPNKFFREGAVSALGATGVDEAVAAVLEFGGEATVRADGAMMARLYEALGAGKNRRAFDALVDGLRSPAAGARAAAARALGALGDIRAVDALIEARTGADGDLGQAIVEALEVLTKITPEESNFDWKTWWLKNRTNYLGKKSA